MALSAGLTRSDPATGADITASSTTSQAARRFHLDVELPHISCHHKPISKITIPVDAISFSAHSGPALTTLLDTRTPRVRQQQTAVVF
jgi:hypothetical protein